MKTKLKTEDHRRKAFREAFSTAYKKKFSI